MKYFTTLLKTARVRMQHEINMPSFQQAIYAALPSWRPVPCQPSLNGPPFQGLVSLSGALLGWGPFAKQNVRFQNDGPFPRRPALSTTTGRFHDDANRVHDQPQPFPHNPAVLTRTPGRFRDDPGRCHDDPRTVSITTIPAGRPRQHRPSLRRHQPGPSTATPAVSTTRNRTRASNRPF